MDIRPGYRKTRNTVSTVGIGIAGFSSVVGFGIFRFAGHRLDIAPGTTVCGISFFLLFFRQLFKGDQFSHSVSPFESMVMIYAWEQMLAEKFEIVKRYFREFIKC